MVAPLSVKLTGKFLSAEHCGENVSTHSVCRWITFLCTMFVELSRSLKWRGHEGGLTNFSMPSRVSCCA